MFDFEARRLFSDLVFKEILQDFNGEYINAVLDFGCGDGYLLKLLKEKFHNIKALCVEKDLTLVKFNSCDKITYEEFIKSHEKYTNTFDIITIVDVIHLLTIDKISTIFNIFYNLLKHNGIIYIILGLYSESRGLYVFNDIIQSLKKVYNIDRIPTIKEILRIFLDRKFQIFIKRIDISNIFGLKIDEKLIENITEYLNYIYNDKLLIKLTKGS